MFLDELDRAIDRIGDDPGQFSEYTFGTRRILLRRFLVTERLTTAKLAHEIKRALVELTTANANGFRILAVPTPPSEPIPSTGVVPN